MQQMTKLDIDTLLAETGHVLAVDDLDAIVDLDTLACAVIKGDHVNDDSLLSRPTFIHDMAFYPPTLARSLFWKDVISEVFPAGHKYETPAFLWICNQPVIDQYLLAMSPKTMKQTVKAFARPLQLNNEDVREVYDIYADKNGDQQHREKRAFGDMIAFLRREYGKDAQYWLNADADEISCCIADYNRKLEAEMSANRGASKGKPIAPQASPKFRHQRKYREAKDALRVLWSGGES